MQSSTNDHLMKEILAKVEYFTTTIDDIQRKLDYLINTKEEAIVENLITDVSFFFFFLLNSFIRCNNKRRVESVISKSIISIANTGLIFFKKKNLNFSSELIDASNILLHEVYCEKNRV